MKRMSKQKQSVIAGALISSAGLFFAKFLGLFYAVPFNSILGSVDNVAIYGQAYNIYSYILNICLAGVPFAISAMVAKYTSRGDYQTALLVKKISMVFMASFGALAMLFMLVCANPFAPMLMPESAQVTSDNIAVLRNVLMIIAIAVFFVPILSSIRGFYQGLKDMEIYALSQVLEQLARVAFLLVSSAIAVYIFKMDRTWAVYFGAFSTSIAAVLAIIHIRMYDKEQMKKIKAAAKRQEVAANNDKGSILREMLFISIPYLLSAIFGYSDSIINSMVLKSGMEAYYFANGGVVEVEGKMVLSDLATAELTTIISAINYGVLKLMSIPMVLAPGFSSAILPHMTSALTRRDYKLVQRNIRDCVDTVLYIALPVCFCLFVYAKPIYAILFPPSAYPADAALADQILSAEAALELCVDVLRWFSLVAFLTTMTTVMASIMMAVGYRALYIKILAIYVVFKFIIAYPMLRFFSYPGLAFSGIIASCLLLLADFYVLAQKFKIHWQATLHRLVVIGVGLLCIWAICLICNQIGLKGYGSGRVIGILQLAVNGSLAMIGYFAFTYLFGLPQVILHIDLSKIFNRGKRS